MKNFTIKENDAFRLRVQLRKCLTPSDLNSIEFIQECLNDGTVIDTSTYNFFMTDEELKTLTQGLTEN